MQHCEEISIYNMIHSSRTWYHKVDDSFVITYHNKHNMLPELKKRNEKIKSAVEEEIKKAMTFLDCLIRKTKKIILL